MGPVCPAKTQGNLVGLRKGYEMERAIWLGWASLLENGSE